MNGLSLGDPIEVAENVLFRELHGETVILNLDTGYYFGLDEIGTRMWLLLHEHRDLNEVLGVMLAEYNVQADTLQNDLLRLAGELSAHGLIRIRRADRNRSAE